MLFRFESKSQQDIVDGAGDFHLSEPASIHPGEIESLQLHGHLIIIGRGNQLLVRRQAGLRVTT